jgi:hypothetical protein
MRPIVLFASLALSGCDQSIPFEDSMGDGVSGDGNGASRSDDDGDGFIQADDCDDQNPEIHPDADEVCDGVDNNCDGATDADDPLLSDGIEFFADADLDGLGDPAEGLTACESPEHHVSNDGDCDDSDPQVLGPTDWYTDADLDGYGASVPFPSCTEPAGMVLNDTDCDDVNEFIHPDAEDWCGDGEDSDCSGPDDDDGSGCINLEPFDILPTVVCEDLAGPLVIESDHFKVHYGADGLWRDPGSAAGLQIRPEGAGSDFVDTTYPGTPYDEILVSIGVENFSLMAFELTCSTPVAQGDVVGAVHEYRTPLGGEDSSAELMIRKTELWNQAGENALVHFWVEPNVLAGSVDIAIARQTDFDMDFDSHGTFDTMFLRKMGSPYASASGPETGLTVGYGSCASDGAAGGMLGKTASSPLCEPDGLTADFKLGYATEGTADWRVPMERAFVVSIGLNADAAEANWDANADDLCGPLWNHWLSPVFDEACDLRGF